MKTTASLNPAAIGEHLDPPMAGEESADQRGWMGPEAQTLTGPFSGLLTANQSSFSSATVMSLNLKRYSVRTVTLPSVSDCVGRR